MTAPRTTSDHGPLNPDAPGPEQNLDRLRVLLREMFQLDRGDLDFGLYRIMNLKSAEARPSELTRG